jgi:hypothetical protein
VLFFCDHVFSSEESREALQAIPSMISTELIKEEEDQEHTKNRELRQAEITKP